MSRSSALGTQSLISTSTRYPAATGAHAAVIDAAADHPSSCRIRTCVESRSGIRHPRAEAFVTRQIELNAVAVDVRKLVVVRVHGGRRRERVMTLMNVDRDVQNAIRPPERDVGGRSCRRRTISARTGDSDDSPSRMTVGGSAELATSSAEDTTAVDAADSLLNAGATATGEIDPASRAAGVKLDMPAVADAPMDVRRPIGKLDVNVIADLDACDDVCPGHDGSCIGRSSRFARITRNA